MEMPNEKELITSLYNLINSLEEPLFVADEESKRFLFQNRAYEDFCAEDSQAPEKLLEELWKKEPGEHCDILLELSRPGQAKQYRQFCVKRENICWMNKDAALYKICDVTNEIRRRHSMERKAYIDPMTGCYNRCFCIERLQKLWNQGTPCIICFMDIDRLKYVNDTYGHREGDCYIKRIADIIRSVFRTGDIICRYGGDEFVSILEYCTVEQARQRMEEARLKAAAMSEKLAYTMDVSYGIEEINPVCGESVEAALIRTDALMYQMKGEKRRK